MNMSDVYDALLGGAIIGLATGVLLWFDGQVAGIHGIINSAMEPKADGRGWRLLFIAGLLLGGVIYFGAGGDSFELRTDTAWPILAVSGFLVGFGTRMGGGCTSGHGVCGIGRGSIRSILATAIFIVSGIVTVTVLRHGLGVVL
jgi:uncharacterized membrane protein YedE/YeeE